MMRRLPTLTAGLFLALTLERVSNFTRATMGASPVNAWLFSAGLACAVYLSAYYSRATGATARKGKRKTPRLFRWNVRTFARLALVVFIVADGAFNLADALRTLIETGQTAYLPFGVAYGVFPTLAAGLLGMLQGYVDRLPHKKRKTGAAGVDWANGVRSVQAWLQTRTQKAAPVVQQVQASGYACGWGCGRSFETLQGRAGHMKACVKRNGHEVEHLQKAQVAK